MDGEDSLHNRVEALERQLIAVSERVDQLVQSLSMQQAARETPALPGGGAIEAAPAGTALDARGTTLLSSLAIASFLLALALILRTIVDNGTVNREIGTAFGIAYGGVLLGYGHFSQHRVRRLPLYAICGGVLVFLVVLETCIRFHSLSTATAYTILSLTLCFMTLLGIGHAAPSVIGVGVVGASLAGMAIDFPRWQFPLLWIILALANLAAFRAARVARWRWLLWPVLLLTLFFWFGWTLQLRAAAPASAQWYLPLLIATLLGYTIMSVLAASSHRRTFGYFEACLPLVAGAGAFLCVEAAAGQLGLTPTGIELAALALGVVSGAAALLFHRLRHNPRVNAAFSVAGAVLIILSLTSWVENTPALLAILAAIALGAGITAHPLHATPLRLFACAAQLAIFSAATLQLTLWAAAPDAAAAAGLYPVLAVLALLHYTWSRAHPPATVSGFHKWIDRNDYSSAVLLLLAVASAFLGAREVLHQALEAGGIFSGNASYCGQSVLLNAGAAVLALWGLYRRSGEIVLISAGVAAAAALKIFAFDLFNCQGLPLVIDVASFALTAALGSIFWNRWQRTAAISSSSFPGELPDHR